MPANQPNIIEYAEIWTTALDQQATQVATSGWMEGNSAQVQYVGGKKFRVPTMLTTGLGDYTRGTGAANRGKYAKGSVELKYTDYELEIDRSAEFAWDRHDVDESGFIIQAPNAMGTFQRENVIPEIDSFRYSRLYAIAAESGSGALVTPQTLTTSNILDEFLKQVRATQNVTGVDTSSLVATVPFSIYSILERSAEIQKSITLTQFAQGGLQFEVKSINGIPIIPVVEDRMKTAYVFHDGDTDLGYTPAAGAKTINWIILPRSLPIAISKTDNLKIFTPDANQSGDDWLIQYRKYHDLWVMRNQRNKIIVSVQQ